jgi:hypothetical protein
MRRTAETVQVVIAHKRFAVALLNPLTLELRVSMEQATKGDGIFD